jgi:ubiquinone/menaquinone biosynthesis C-methylase UbiE
MSDLASRHSARHGSAPDRKYLPGMGLNVLLPLYDPFTRLIGIRSAHRQLAGQAELDSAGRVLEIGCGTGNLALLVKQTHPQLEVVGLDPDPRALARARQKARSAGVALQLDRGFADQLPYADRSFDRVLSALMFHHLNADLRVASLREVLRVLRPEGSLYLMDFGGDSRHLHGLARFARRSHALQDNWDDRIPALLREAGFGEAIKTGHITTRIGGVTYYGASRP